MRRFIVAEVSKNWPQEFAPGLRQLLAERFEDVINDNASRGYRLHSWKLSRVYTPEGDQLNETIIAVFERRDGEA